MTIEDHKKSQSKSTPPLYSIQKTPSNQAFQARSGKAEPAIWVEQDCENIRKERDKYKILSENYARDIENLKKLLLKEKELNLELELQNEDLRASVHSMQALLKQIDARFEAASREFYKMGQGFKSRELEEDLLKITSKRVNKFKSEKKKIVKEKSKVKFNRIDESLNELKNLLKNSGSEECKGLHREVVSGLADVQKSLVLLKFEVIDGAAKYGQMEAENMDLQRKVRHWKSVATTRRKQFINDFTKSESLNVERIYAAELNELREKLHKQGDKSESFIYLRQMPEIFKMGLEAFNQKLETLLQNLHFTREHDLFRGWLQSLADFVGKSSGEVAKIETLLLRKS